MKKLLSFIENLPTIPVEIHGQHYPVHVDGTGAIPFISIGIGSHMQMTLSSRIKKLVTVYSSDLYWINARKINQPYLLSMENIIDDIISTIEQLNIKRPIISGFSCFGILALEVAKRLGSQIRGVVLVSTPPTWNDEVISIAQNYFDTYASQERKINDTQRKKHFEKIRQPNESLGSVNAYEADAARYWKDFNVSREFFELLWQGIHVDDHIINHFFSNILPRHDLKKNLDQVLLPVVLFAGQYDFDSVPLALWDSFPKPKYFTQINCVESGHWPQLECREFFEEKLIDWLEQKI